MIKYYKNNVPAYTDLTSFHVKDVRSTSIYYYNYGNIITMYIKIINIFIIPPLEKS